MTKPPEQIAMRGHLLAATGAIFEMPQHVVVGLALVALAADFIYSLRNSEKRLDVMAHLMGDDIGAGEFAGGVQLSFHVLVEAEIDVDLGVAWTIEGPDRRVRQPARGIDAAAKEHQHGLLVLLAHLLEEIIPDHFGVVENDLGEMR